MRVLITGATVITPYGMFSAGDEVGEDKAPKEYLVHLVEQAGAAHYMNIETKVDDDYEVKKSLPSTLLSQQAKASPKKTRGRPRKTQK